MRKLQLAYMQKDHEATQWKHKVEELKATIEEQKTLMEESEEENERLWRAHAISISNMMATQAQLQELLQNPLSPPLVSRQAMGHPLKMRWLL